MKSLFVSIAFLLLTVPLLAQTFTMGKDCKAKNAEGISFLKEKKYQQAMDAFAIMAKSCKTKDGKEAVATGKAEALNGLGRHEEAIAASDAALKITKNRSLKGYFQKAVAQMKLNQPAAANASFASMISLTEKNKDLKTRASNYALMSLLHWQQLSNKDSAYYFLDKAMQLDSTNADFYIRKGDYLMDEKKYEEVFEQYDKAVLLGKNDLEMYMIRSDARIKILQEKYQTNNTQELRSKINDMEKQQLCKELDKAISLGLRDMQKDMFAALICK